MNFSQDININSSPLYLASNLKQKIATVIFTKFRLCIAVAVTIFMVLLPLFFFLQDISSSTLFEESVGFRFFHSLRLAFSNEHPWVPQGQLPGILHILIQRILTIIGYPTNQFFPRVDIFSTIAVVVPLLLTGGIYYWATKPIKTIYIQSIFAMLFVCLFYSPRFQDGWMLLPDYHIWMVPLALLAVGWCMRILLVDKIFSGLSNREAILLGLYAAACCSVKITLATYPIIIGFIYISLDKRPSSLLKILGISIPVSLVTWFVILAIYYQGDIWVVPEHIQSLATFTDHQVSFLKDSFVDFLRVFYPITLIDIFTVIPLLLLFSLWSRLRYHHQSVVGALFPVCIFELYMLYQRNYTHTNVEVQYLFFIVSAIVAIDLYENNCRLRQAIDWLSTNPRYKRVKSRYAIILLSILIPTAIHYNYINSRIQPFVRYLQQLNTANLGLQFALATNHGKTLFLIPIIAIVDEFNLRTIDNGLFKAATGLHPTWDKTSYLAKLYNDRWYASNVRTMPEIEQFQNIVYRTLANETFSEAIKRLQNHYKADLSQFNCLEPAFAYKIITDESLVFCSKN